MKKLIGGVLVVLAFLAITAFVSWVAGDKVLCQTVKCLEGM